MKYRLTVETPLAAGDGDRLLPMDYMVWKDHINVLDQERIFRLLSKGPRLDGYLAQLKKATRLDFASWGGFAQNFAGRRIPFEHPSAAAYWEKAPVENLAIPTFMSGLSGPYLPGSVIKGALRGGLLAAGIREGALKEVADRATGDRLPRRPADGPEEMVLGNYGQSRMRSVGAGDSAPVGRANFRVCLLRTAVLQQKAPGQYALGWKQIPRGAVEARRVADSTPHFAEMAMPGTVFEGAWSESAFLAKPEIQRAARWREPGGRKRVFAGANLLAARLIAAHLQFAEWTGLELLAANLAALAEKTESLDPARACMVSLGLGGGMLSKAPYALFAGEDQRRILKAHPFYSRAAATGMPLPKTRKVLFAADRPSTIPGFAILEVSEE